MCSILTVLFRIYHRVFRSLARPDITVLVGVKSYVTQKSFSFLNLIYPFWLTEHKKPFLLPSFSCYASAYGWLGSKHELSIFGLWIKHEGHSSGFLRGRLSVTFWLAEAVMAARNPLCSAAVLMLVFSSHDYLRAGPGRWERRRGWGVMKNEWMNEFYFTRVVEKTLGVFTSSPRPCETLLLTKDTMSYSTLST